MEAAAASWTGRPSIWADPDFQACGRVGGEVGRCCSQSRHLGLPFSSLSPPRQGYRCTWDRGIAGHELSPRAVLASPYSAPSIFLNDRSSRTLPTRGKGATRMGLSVPSGCAPAAAKPASLRTGKQPRVPAVPRKPGTLQT